MGPKKVEIKFSFEGQHAERAQELLGLDVGDGFPRRIFFSEVRVPPSAALPLSARGIILRSRRSADGGDTTLKLRGLESSVDETAWADLADGWEGAKLEGDWTGARHLVSASLKHDLDPDDHDATSDPKDAAAVYAALSRDQVALARAWVVPLARMQPWGPVRAVTWSGVAVGNGPADCDVEQWVLGGTLLEVSRRVNANDAPSAQHEISSVFRELKLSPVPVTKTERAIRTLMAL